jgi:ribulose-5-phosphate 4-epimerase/fuculose-1-phosphate aldolase
MSWHDCWLILWLAQMIKGLRRGGTGPTLSFLDTLEVPIIENTPNEEDLKDSMADAMLKYTDAPAVLVRRHGVYVWGGSNIAILALCCLMSVGR